MTEPDNNRKHEGAVPKSGRGSRDDVEASATNHKDTARPTPSDSMVAQYADNTAEGSATGEDQHLDARIESPAMQEDSALQPVADVTSLIDSYVKKTVAGERKVTARASATPLDWESIPLYVRITAEFRRLPEGEAKRNFALAIERSFALDTTGQVPPQPASPTDIQNELGFNLVAQKQYRISLGKEVAFNEFLYAINAPINQYLYKKLEKSAYATRFRRSPALLYSKQMILTVAEWLHFVPYEFVCPLPLAIEKHLRP